MTRSTANPKVQGGHKVGVQNSTIQVPIANWLAGEENIVGLVKAWDLICKDSRAASSMLLAHRLHRGSCIHRGER